MRVAVRHTEKGHPNRHWFAFGVGRITGYDDLMTGESYSEQQVAERLLERAKETFPEKDGYEHRIETLHIKGTDEDGGQVGEWHPIGKSKLPLIDTPGAVHEQVIEVSQAQEASAR